MSSPARTTATWRRETSASTCASTRRPAYRRSATNDLIGNFKKSPRLRGTPAWSYKERALERLAAELAAALDPAWLATATLVPIPPSRARSDPAHDDRMLRLLRRLEAHLTASGPGDRPDAERLEPHSVAPARLAPSPHLVGLRPGRLDIREILLQRESTLPAHGRPCRPTPAELASLYEIDETLADPPPVALGLFDDVLTTGAHFQAAQHLLRRRFSGTPIAGIFLARTLRLDLPA
jgi:hypothetical protein